MPALPKPEKAFLPFLILFSILLLVGSTGAPLSLFLANSLLAVLLIWISVVDSKSYIIPNSANLAALLLGVGIIFHIDPFLLRSHFLAAGTGFLLMLVVRSVFFYMTGAESLGLGDVKFAGTIGIWVGPFGLPSVILLAALAGIAFAIVSKILHLPSHEKRIPFGPFLSVAFFWVWLFGPI